MFEGTIPALITPFKETSLEVDYEEIDQLIEWHLECGVTGFVACGTTAEILLSKATYQWRSRSR